MIVIKKLLNIFLSICWIFFIPTKIFYCFNWSDMFFFLIIEVDQLTLKKPSVLFFLFFFFLHSQVSDVHKYNVRCTHTHPPSWDSGSYITFDFSLVGNLHPVIVRIFPIDTIVCFWSIITPFLTILWYLFLKNYDKLCCAILKKKKMEIMWKQRERKKVIERSYELIWIISLTMSIIAERFILK